MAQKPKNNNPSQQPPMVRPKPKLMFKPVPIANHQLPASPEYVDPIKQSRMPSARLPVATVTR